jgi:hypothetical protein
LVDIDFEWRIHFRIMKNNKKIDIAKIIKNKKERLI